MKKLSLLGLIVVGVVTVLSFPDIKRYLRIRSM
jgi:hypothetical protein